MNVLSSNGIELSWLTCYVGFKKNWLKKRELVEFVEQSLNDSNCVDIIIEMFVIENESDVLVQPILEKILLKEYGKVLLQDDSEFQQAIRLWHLGFLLEIEKASMTVSEKLGRIAELWADLGYSTEWKDFIYYMPSSQLPSETQSSEQVLYEKFLEFLDREKGRVNSETAR